MDEVAGGLARQVPAPSYRSPCTITPFPIVTVSVWQLAIAAVLVCGGVLSCRPTPGSDLWPAPPPPTLAAPIGTELQHTVPAGEEVASSTGDPSSKGASTEQGTSGARADIDLRGSSSSTEVVSEDKGASSTRRSGKRRRGRKKSRRKSKRPKVDHQRHTLGVDSRSRLLVHSTPAIAKSIERGSGPAPAL